MTPIDKLKAYLDEKERLEKAATKGPWAITGEGHYQSRVCETVTANIHANDKIKVDIDMDEHNASLIVHSRNNAAKEVQAMRELLEALEAVVQVIPGGTLEQERIGNAAVVHLLQRITVVV